MKQFSKIILFCLSLILVSCAEATVDSKMSQVNSTTDISQEDNKSTTDLNPTSTNQTLAKNSNKCQPVNVQPTENSSQTDDVNEMVKKPETREEFNAWLENIIGSVKVATLTERKFMDQYLGEGDFNGDGCGDVAIIVENIKNKSDVVSMENFASGTTVQNLNSKTIYKGSDKTKLPFSKEFASQLKPKQNIAIVVVFGGQDSWSWKYNAPGREFLLYDSIFTPSKVSGHETGMTLFSAVNKAKPEEDDDDLIYRFPENAVGDCVYTATQTNRKKVEFSELSNKFLICYDGTDFFDKKLPDSKSYPEL